MSEASNSLKEVITNQTALLISSASCLTNNAPDISLHEKSFNEIEQLIAVLTVRVSVLGAERAIHFAMFAFLLVGLCSLTAWISYAYLQQNLILEIAGMALSWGAILLVLYAGFKKLEWDWWS